MGKLTPLNNLNFMIPLRGVTLHLAVLYPEAMPSG